MSKKQLDYDDLEQIMNDIEYEEDFYKQMAHNEEFVILEICAVHGDSEEEQLTNKITARAAEKENKRILYRLDYEKHSVLYCSKDPTRLAIIPNDQQHGWGEF